MLGALLKPVLGAVAGSLGSSLLSKSRSSQTSQESLDLNKLVKDAQAAGFNPLTVLQATGGRGFGGTSQASSSDFDVGSMAAGAALSGIGDYFANDQQRRLAEAEIDLTEARAASLRAAPQNFAAPPKASIGNQAVRDLSEPANYLPADNATPEKVNATDLAGQELMGNMAVAGDVVEPSRNWSDAEVIEGRYGDVVSWAYGLATLGADARKHLLARTGTDNIDDAVGVILKKSRGWRRDLLNSAPSGRVNVNKAPAVDFTLDRRAQRTNTGGY